MAPKSKVPWTRHAEYLEVRRTGLDDTDFFSENNQEYTSCGCNWGCLKHLLLDIFVPIGRCMFFFLDTGLDCSLAYLYFRGEYHTTVTCGH